MSDIYGKLEVVRTSLAIPDSFRQTALAFPEKIDRALAVLNDPRVAKELLHRADALCHYAARVKADTEIVNLIQYGKIKIQARIGELCPATPPEERGRGKKNGSAGTPIFHPRTISVFRRVQRNLDKLDRYRDECSEHGEEMSTHGFIDFAGGTAHVGHAAGQEEWYTPPELLDPAREVLGGFDLDPASSEKAQENVRAGHFFTKQDDGLTKPWAGRVWLNPPYAVDKVGRFVEKLCRHVRAGDVRGAILLVNNATETRWFSEASDVAAALCLPTGRVRFLDEAGNRGAPLQGQAVLYFGDNVPAFERAWAQFGPVWLPGSGG
jgi:ParB family chromosome partitioning protein